MGNNTGLRATLLLAVIALLFGAGCSALPGLQVLAGQDTPASADRVAELSELVMADKTGVTDPALSSAADRIESATGDVDIIEIRKDLNADTFNVYMLLNTNQSTTQAEFVAQIRRAVELTWQGTMNQSQGSDMIKVIVLSPGLVPTLDKGLSFIGQVSFDFEMARPEIVAYLADRPNNTQDFIDLIAQGKLNVIQPEQTEFYQGEPNHPMFMLADLAAQAQAQRSNQNGG
jgi:hypothetical protein